MQLKIKELCRKSDLDINNIKLLKHNIETS